MKQGTSRTVLVSDLAVSDGPFQDAARDFVAGTCSMCRTMVLDQDARFHDAGYLCTDCWQYAAGIVH
ncbi:MAG: hypothetical protein U9R51_07600 [Actinomycetota bacterium]|nr:hypothetical protein [Actinomycetota bacterium]